jgi:hypothetical protein
MFAHNTVQTNHFILLAVLAATLSLSKDMLPIFIMEIR